MAKYITELDRQAAYESQPEEAKQKYSRGYEKHTVYYFLGQ